MMKVSVFIALIVATPAIAADQFDLMCTSNRGSDHYRIDLVRGEWCHDKCEAVFKIEEVTSGLLTLHNQQPTEEDRTTSYTRINRVTGEWSMYYSTRYTTILRSGVCAPAPFSGMPQPKF